MSAKTILLVIVREYYVHESALIFFCHELMEVIMHPFDDLEAIFF